MIVSSTAMTIVLHRFSSLGLKSRIDAVFDFYSTTVFQSPWRLQYS